MENFPPPWPPGSPSQPDHVSAWKIALISAHVDIFSPSSPLPVHCFPELSLLILPPLAVAEEVFPSLARVPAPSTLTVFSLPKSEA